MDPMTEVFNMDQNEAVSRDDASWQLSVADSEANTRMKNACAAKVEAIAGFIGIMTTFVTMLIIAGIVYGVYVIVGWF